MTDRRWKELMARDDLELTPEEIAAGWHYCHSEWDRLLIGPGMKEFEVCKCEPPPKPAA